MAEPNINGAETFPPDSLPGVSFDIALGKRYQHVDFSYRAYIEYLREKGLSLEQICSSNVSFEARSRPISYLANGTYSDKSRAIKVYVPRKRSTYNASSTLAHEGQHKADHDQGRFKWHHNALNDVAGVAGLAAIPTRLANWGLDIDLAFSHSNLVGALANSMDAAAFGATVIWATTYYLLLAPEKWAREAAKNNFRTFVYFEPRGESSEGSNMHQQSDSRVVTFLSEALKKARLIYSD